MIELKTDKTALCPFHMLCPFHKLCNPSAHAMVILPICQQIEMLVVFALFVACVWSQQNVATYHACASLNSVFVFFPCLPGQWRQCRPTVTGVPTCLTLPCASTECKEDWQCGKCPEEPFGGYPGNRQVRSLVVPSQLAEARGRVVSILLMFLFAVVQGFEGEGHALVHSAGL